MRPGGVDDGVETGTRVDRVDDGVREENRVEEREGAIKFGLETAEERSGGVGVGWEGAGALRFGGLPIDLPVCFLS